MSVPTSARPRPRTFLPTELALRWVSLGVQLGLYLYDLRHRREPTATSANAFEHRAR